MYLLTVDEIRSRLLSSKASLRDVAEATGLTPEGVRRYRSGYVVQGSPDALQKLTQYLMGGQRGNDQPGR